MTHAAIQQLINAVPSASLRLGTVAGDKPGIYAGDSAICRVKEGPVGDAYGALIVGAINALPQLLATPQRSAKAQPMDSLLREQVVQRITNVLAMRPGAQNKQSTIWAKLIWTTVETCLADNLKPDGSPEDCATAIANVAYEPETVQSARLAAVLEFSAMMMTACEGTADSELPNMELVISEWSRMCNTIPSSTVG